MSQRFLGEKPVALGNSARKSSKSNISEHIKHILEEGELTLEATVRKFRTVQEEGGREVGRNIAYYNLDMVLAIGYRVRSNVRTNFRKWATSTLKEYLTKGFALNEDVSPRHHCNLRSKLLRNFILGEQFIELSLRLKVSNGESLCVMASPLALRLIFRII